MPQGNTEITSKALSMAVETVVIRITQDTRELIKTIDKLEELGVIDKQNAAQFRENEAKFKQGQEQAAKSVGRTNKQMQNTGRTVGALDNQFRNLAATIAAAFTVQQVISFTRSVIDLRAETENTQVAFENMLGSASKSNKLLKDLADFGARTPFNIQEIERGAQALLVAGERADDIIPTLNRLGNAASGTNTNFQELVEVYGIFKVQNEILTQDLRQLTARGIPILQELAESFNTTESGVFKFASEGKIKFKDIEQAFVNMSAEGGRFFNLMDKQSATTGGEISNLQDEFTMFKRELGEELAPTIRAVVSGLRSFVKNLDPNALIRYGKFILLGVQALVSYKITAMAAARAQVALTAAQQAGSIAGNQFFGMLVKGIPIIGTVISVVGLVASAFSLFGSKTEEATEKLSEHQEHLKRMGEIRATGNDLLAREIAQLTTWTNTLKDANTSADTREKLITRINDKYGTTLQNLKDEKDFVDQVDSAYNNVIETLRRKILLQIAEDEVTELYREQIRLTRELTDAQKKFDDAAVNGNTPLNQKFMHEASTSLTVVNGKLKQNKAEIASLMETYKDLDISSIFGDVSGDGGGAGGDFKDAADGLDVLTEAVDELFSSLQDLEKPFEQAAGTALKMMMLLNREKYDDEDDIRKADLEAEIKYLEDRVIANQGTADEILDMEIKIHDKKMELARIEADEKKKLADDQAKTAEKLGDEELEIMRRRNQALEQITTSLTRVIVSNDEERAESFAEFVKTTLSLLLKETRAVLQAAIFKSFASSIESAVPLPIALARAAVKTGALTAAFGTAQAAIQAITFHDGTDYVPGGGGQGLRSDETWAKLQQGEGVARASMNMKYKGLVKAMNEDRVDTWFASQPQMTNKVLKDMRSEVLAQNIAASMMGQEFDDQNINKNLKAGIKADKVNTQYLAKVIKKSMKSNPWGVGN